MKILGCILAGTLAAPASVALVGAIWGGIVGAAPCHTAPDFVSGAVFGATAFLYMFGLPSLAVGAALGAVVWSFLTPSA